MNDSARLERWVRGLPSEYPKLDWDSFDDYQGPDSPSDDVDSLYEDGNGHGVDLEEGIFEMGLAVCLEYIAESSDDMLGGMLPWGAELLLSIEAVAACAGVPSGDRELSRIRAWGREINYSPPEDLVRLMLSKIDFVLERWEADPDFYGAYSTERKREIARNRDRAIAEKMRRRISSLLP